MTKPKKEIVRLSLTYGVLPTYKQFKHNFEAEIVGGLFKVRNCPRVGDYDFSCKELWREVNNATKDWRKNGWLEDDTRCPGDWASCALLVLGFKWV